MGTTESSPGAVGVPVRGRVAEPPAEAAAPVTPPVPTALPDVVDAPAFDPDRPASRAPAVATASEVPEVVVVALPEARPELPLDPEVAQARAQLRQGEVRDSITRLQALRRDKAPARRVLVLATLLEARLARGDLDEAAAVGDEIGPLLDAGGSVASVAHHARGTLAAALGDDELAVAHLLTAGRVRPDVDPDLAPWRSEGALAQLRSGDPRGAGELARRGVAFAREDGRAHVVAHAVRVLAAVDPGVDRLAVLLEARSLLPAGTADRLAAQIDTDLAGLVLLRPRASQPAAAPYDAAVPDPLTLLRSAERLAGRHELWPLQSRVRRLLEVLGETPRRVSSEAESVLTASELRVARLAADGLGNRAIAVETGVSVKAVEWHLGHVYRKLAIASRRELAETLGSPS